MPGVRQQVQRRQDPPADIMISDETRTMFAQMAMAVPDADGAGSERIVLSILKATTWDDLDAPWDKTAKDELIDKEQWIYSITRRPSSFADGLGIFLVIRAKLVDADEETVWVSSSISVVAQLVKAYMLGAFPLCAILRRSERPTERGYYPEHLEFVGSAGGPNTATPGE